MARAVHDNLDAFSSAEDTSSSSTLLCTLIEKVDFGKDVERTLDALSNFRQVFTNVDEVTAVLVERTLSLAEVVLTSRGGGAHPATAAFLRTVFSSAALTIPSIDDPLLASACTLLRQPLRSPQLPYPRQTPSFELQLGKFQSFQLIVPLLRPPTLQP